MDPPDNAHLVEPFLVQLVTTSLVSSTFYILTIFLRNDCAIQYLSTCATPDAIDLSSEIAAAAPVEAVVAPAPETAPCRDGLELNWIGQCAPPFGLDSSLVVDARDVCDGIYQKACGGWKLPGPRAFTLLDRFNRERLRQVKQAQALQPDSWSRVASACHATLQTPAQPSGRRHWLSKQLLTAIRSRGFAAALGTLADMGINVPFEVVPRITPWQPRRPAVMVRVNVDAMVLPSDLTPIDPTWPLENQKLVMAQTMLVEMRALQTAISVQSRPLTTLLAYHSDPKGAARDLRLSAGNHTWLRDLREGLPAQLREMGLWLQNFELVRGELMLLHDNADKAIDLVETLVWVHYNTVAMGSARPEPLLTSREDDDVDPHLTVGLDPMCEQLASNRVWWRTDATFAKHVVSDSAVQIVADLFARVQAEAEIVVRDSQQLRNAELRDFLQAKIRAIKLRLPDASSASHSKASLRELPTKLPLELRRAAGLRWQYTTPVTVDGRLMEAIDSASSSSNAFYNPFDNTVTVLPGMLSGSFVPDFGAGDNREEILSTLGFVLAHEIGHALDTTGAWFDETGGWRDSNRDGLHELFQNMRCLVDVYDTAGTNGLRTLDENFADWFGYAVVTRLLADTEEPEQAVLLQAQLWCGSSEGDSADDPHSPGPARVDVGWTLHSDWIKQNLGCNTEAPQCQPL